MPKKFLWKISIWYDICSNWVMTKVKQNFTNKQLADASKAFGRRMRVFLNEHGNISFAHPTAKMNENNTAEVFYSITRNPKGIRLSRNYHYGDMRTCIKYFKNFPSAIRYVTNYLDKRDDKFLSGKN